MAFRPLTRKEKFLSAIAGETTETPKPLTRKERFYNALLGKGEAPEPMTREEVLFKKIVENGGGGGSVSAPLIVHSLVEDNGTFAKENFKSITIMTESVGESAFERCTGLETVEFVGVTSIGDNAFLGCSLLTSAHISDIAAWCGISFYGFWSTPAWAGADIYLNGERVINLVIPDTVTSIGDYAFCKWLTLASVIFPDSVTSIGQRAFYQCEALPNVTIGNGVTSIGYSAFGYCNSLTSVTIPISVESIGRCAFDACDALTEFNYEGTVAEWTALDTQGIINREGVTVHCADGDTVASYGSDD